MNNSALVAEALWKRYGARRPYVLQDVELALPRGSVTAMVGPNGAGKSTLIRSWMGFERPTSGRVLVDGIDPWVDRTAAVSRLGYVPQASSLYRNLDVLDHLQLAQLLRPGFDRSVAQRHLIALGIPPHQRAGELSGGQQAQLALAIALGTRASVLILDEPLASLDPLARREFLQILVAEVRENGTTAVLSSHIVTDVQEACDRIVVLSGGQIAMSDSVSGALQSHRVVIGSDDSDAAIGRFAGPDGSPQTLFGDVDTLDGAGRPATLEEVVLGYLASAEPRQSVADAWGQA